MTHFVRYMSTQKNIGLPLSVVFWRSRVTKYDKYDRVSDPKFFTNSSWFPAMAHRHRDRYLCLLVVLNSLCASLLQLI